MTISGKAKLAGVIGWPVSHSLSPKLHGFWLDELGVDGAYLPLAVKPEDFDLVVKSLPKMGFRGVNITVPHKEAAFKACDRLTEQAKRIGAVNTIIIQDDGSLLGDNTDGFGFMANLKTGQPGWDAGRGPAVVLGAGGAARAVLDALLEADCPEIRLTNRTFERAKGLFNHFNTYFPGKISLIEWEKRDFALENANLVVNTTSLGMHGQPPLEISLDRLPADCLVTDIVYVPLVTPILDLAHKRGNPTVDGLGMLLHQARPGFDAWFGQMPQVTDELRLEILAGLD